MNKYDYYIARKAWKAEYARLTAKIQEAKRQRKEAARAFAALGNISYSYRLTPEQQALNRERINALYHYNDLHNSCLLLKKEARDKLQELEALKDKAREAFRLKQESQMRA